MGVVRVGCEEVVIDWWSAMDNLLVVTIGAQVEGGPFLEGELCRGLKVGPAYCGEAAISGFKCACVVVVRWVRLWVG